MMLGMVTMIAMPYKLAIGASKKMHGIIQVRPQGKTGFLVRKTVPFVFVSETAHGIIQRVPAIDAYAIDGLAPSASTPGALVFRNVRFAYRKRSTKSPHLHVLIGFARPLCSACSDSRVFQPTRAGPRCSRVCRCPSRRARSPRLSEVRPAHRCPVCGRVIALLRLCILAAMVHNMLSVSLRSFRLRLGQVDGDPAAAAAVRPIGGRRASRRHAAADSERQTAAGGPRRGVAGATALQLQHRREHSARRGRWANDVF